MFMFAGSRREEQLSLTIMFAGSRRAEQLSLRSQQRVVATVEDSVLRWRWQALSLRKRMFFLRLKACHLASPLLQTNELAGADQDSPSG